jgi:hypothetical protein
MSARADRLAQEFSDANDELLGLLERATPEQWLSLTADEGELRSVAVIAHHVAEAHVRIASRVEAFATGQPVPARRPELFDARNADQARDNPEPEQRATIERLRTTGAVVRELIGALSDANLERTGTEDAGADILTTAQVIELRQIGHVRSHLASIRTVLG